MATELEKKFDPDKTEEKWYKHWEENGFFKPQKDKTKKHFSIVIPPPNVTGSLHMGHALNNTIQDISTRYKRMSGYDTLWLPGTDHAGIATQNVVEVNLLNQNIKREDLGRKKFIDKVWEWKKEYGDRIINQLKRLGSSCDWSRLRFTMDEGLSEAVKEVFVQLYNDGLIYQGNYIINWCPRCNTALADDEVEHKELDGHFFYIKYFLKDSDEFLTIATTRPETMLGDTAVAVHPDDERYKQYIGKTVILPLVGRELKVIADNYVDPAFGTGSLKITPAHDPNDFLIGKKHNLEEINILNDDATINENGGKYEGLTRTEAREKILEDLKEQNFLIKIEDHKHSVGHCYRCKTVVEPYISKQWFVKMKPLAEKAIEAVKNEDVKFHPKNWENTYFEWMYNVRDWCISRQIWWGHRIPVWYCQDCNEIIVRKEAPDKCPKCQSNNLEQDKDVLDTWFSSALWPFSTLGWPDNTEDLKLYYPTSVLSTGFDIIFFWVARMVMMGLYFMKEVPFKDVYIHALVRTETGEKMSKSSGNAIDPLDVIKDYGTDALRFTLAALAIQGRDIKLSTSRLEGYRNFLNKIWNASRFIFMNYSDEIALTTDINKLELSLSDKWILHNLSETTKKINIYLEDYKFNEYAKIIYDFVWHKYCDWYIELTKSNLYSDDIEIKNKTLSILFYVLKNILKLSHPVIPFITEEIWSKLPEQLKDNESIMLSEWPEIKEEFNDESNKMNLIIQVISGIRNIRSQMNIAPVDKVEAFIDIKDQKVANLDFEMSEIIIEYKDYIFQLAKVENIIVDSNIVKPEKSATAVLAGITIYIPLADLIDYETEITRINKQLQKVEQNLIKSERSLKNPNFVNRAPAAIIEKEKNKLEEFKQNKKELEEVLNSLK